MATKLKLPVAFLLLSLVILSAGLALATKDPELKQCQHQCKQQRQYGPEEKEECRRECERYYREKKERERVEKEKEKEKERWREEEEERGGRDEWSFMVDTEKDQQVCVDRCLRRWGSQQHSLQVCVDRCLGRWGSGQQSALCRLECKTRHRSEEVEEEEQEEEEGGETGNPYVFEDRHFATRAKTQHGRIDVLQKFTKKSKLLRGIENFRVGFLEANPQTFIAPSHWDADGVLFFIGRGTITMIREGKRESFNVEHGDIVRVPAGTLVYLINRDQNEKLYVINFLSPVNIPGEYEAFHGPGGEDPESFYSAFSSKLLEAALKSDRGRLQRIFRQRQGVIIKACKQQIEAMSHHREEGGTIWPFGGESSGPFNLFRKNPTTSNNCGQLLEVTPVDWKQLQDLDLAVSFANITKGSIAGPFYNSKATKISFVVDGDGYLEMACPHVSSSRRRRQEAGGGQKYQKISSRLRRGTVFVVPAGHPVALVSSENKNLKVLCFEVNAQGNFRYSLAGKKNVINEMEKEAKELAFGVPAREVEQVFGNQNEELFFAGPSSWEEREESRANA